MGKIIRNGVIYTGGISGGGDVKDDGTLARKYVDTTSETNLYVSSNTGSDANAGTSDAPFKTINKALSKLPDIIGDTKVVITIIDGTYNEAVTLKGYTGDITLKIDGGVVINGDVTISSCSNISIDIVDFKKTNSLYVTPSYSGCGIAIYNSNVTIELSNIWIMMDDGYGIETKNSSVSINASVDVDSCIAGVNADSASNVFIKNLSGNGETSAYVKNGSILTISKNSFEASDSLYYRNNDALSLAKYNEPISESEYNAMEEAGTLDPNTVYYVMNDDEYDNTFCASNIDFDDTIAKLGATNVQVAIEKLNAKVTTANSAGTVYKKTHTTECQNNTFASDTNCELTLPAGVYVVTAMMKFMVTSGTGIIAIAQGSSIHAQQSGAFVNLAYNPQYVTVTSVIELTAQATLTPKLYQNSGATASADVTMTAVKIK